MYWFALVVICLAELIYIAGFSWMASEMLPGLKLAWKEEPKTRFFLLFFPIYLLLCFLWLPVMAYAGYLHITEC